MLGHLAGRTLYVKVADTSHMRGVVVESRAWSLLQRKEEGISITGILVPLEDETKHFKCIGTTGTGKSRAFAKILQGALMRGDRAVIADPDADI